MSLQALNDENSRNDLMLESCDILFSPPQPTGRPSILRPSQKENLPPKSAIMKVSFQTPMRDPQTQRIMTPNSLSKHDNFTLEDCTQALQQLHLSNATGLCLEEPIKLTEDCSNDQSTILPDAIPVKSGAYSIDFDDLDNINPFKTTNKMCNSPVKSECNSAESSQSDHSLETLEIKKPFEEAPVNVCFQKEDSVKVSLPNIIPTGQTCSDSEVLSTSDKISTVDNTLSLTVGSDTPETVSNLNAASCLEHASVPFEKERSSAADNEVDHVAKGDLSECLKDVPNSPPLPKGSYKFDPDQLDMVDPFKTGGSKLQNSPPCGSKPPSSEDKAKAEPMKLEFDFGDGNAPVRKPPPKKLGKRPGVKPAPKKLAAACEKTSEKPKEQNVMPQEEIPVPKAAYAFDWEKYDDPNFNPFGCGGSKITSSPAMSKVGNESTANMASQTPVESPSKITSDQPEVVKVINVVNENEKVQQRASCEDEENSRNLAAAPSNDKEEENPSIIVESVGKGETSFKNDREMTEVNPKLDAAVESQEFKPATEMDFIPATEMDFIPATEMGFKPATEIEGFGLPIEFDYLENFGTSSFKESALRKQSLYLKFDPLLRDSPKKTAPAGIDFPSVPLKSSSDLFGTSSESILQMTPLLENEEKPKGLDLLGTFTVSDVAPLITEPVDNVGPVNFPVNSDGAIVEVLKYSQKDMDAAIANVRLEVKEKEYEILEWKKKHEKLYLEYIEMGKIIAEFEGTITQMIEDSQRQKELAKLEVNKVLQEKQQVQIDLNSMEKSFSELFKRFEKQKDVLDGYRKNEEALKKCVEDYLARIKKEEQRYQALKAHAEEKLNRANEEIAQVRSKAKSEATALQAMLRKEQMRVQSLERALEQKVR
ncbi:transforming acidic coiled-coil-containing protein 3 [Bombina bombina]|uniref:transforming acidic coiled-coil-containing protein 3 n=1 Tax=Bombina bombina TaxID=8345 RepID=UPI00235B070E|nr:transforming acidic coiled-coil-containing protein 3 [Bombina bombina]XP_053560205.1 transforming acidic coiled-coil-containing protein 3 [Bombina bombina]